MDHMSVQELWRIKVQLSRQQRSSDSRFTNHSKSAEAHSLVSCPSWTQPPVLVRLLVLLCFLHSAHSFSNSCAEFCRGGTEHSIEPGGQKLICHHDGSAARAEKPNSYGGGSESSWSCLDLQTSTTPKRPFFSQSTSHIGPSQASSARVDVQTQSISALLKLGDELCDKLRIRKLGPICNHGEAVPQESDGDGAQSELGRRRAVRRSLLTATWKPVIVTDSVIVVIGFVLAVSALSCLLRQRRAVKADADIAVPAITPSTAPVSVVTGPGRRERAEGGEDARGRRSQTEKEEGQERWGRADDDRGQARKPEEVVGAETTQGSGQLAADESEGNRQRVGEVEEGPGRPSPGATVSVPAPDWEGETTTAVATATATAHRSKSQTVRYRAEALCVEELAKATGDFDESNKLGDGSFGTVYRGLLSDGRVVAIKRAHRNNMLKILDKQCAFKTELDLMSRLHHKHLVNLVGYCTEHEGDEMMLVYEYMPNGSLSDHLHHKHCKSRSLSSWKIRIRAALEAARGIEYIHTYAEPPVIHRDIKSSNLLLDANGSVRVSDFGLGLIFRTAAASDSEDEEFQGSSTNAAGTMGYMDPEYYRYRYLTSKSDVYSFGVVILELLTGKRAIHRRNNSHVSVVDYAVPAIEAGEVARIVDPRLPVPMGHEFAALKVMAEVGRQAVRLRGKDRPGMTEIVRQLEQAVTLGRSRHIAPLPSFGVQIGSSFDPPHDHSGDRPVAAFHLDPAAAAAAARLDNLVGSVEDEDKDEEEEPTESSTSWTDVDASAGTLPASQTGTNLKELLREAPRKIQTTHEDDGGFELEDCESDVNLELYQKTQHIDTLGWPLARDSASAAGSDHAMDTGSSWSSAAAALAAVYHSGGKGSEPEESSSEWERSSETLLEELRESWWRSRLSEGVKLGGHGPGVSDVIPKEASITSATPVVHLDYYSRKAVDDSSLDHPEFSTSGALGPPEDFHTPPPSPPPPPPDPNHGSGPPAAVPGH